ncbi:MAG: segregation and condensation protein A [Actinomycetota bacterium]
MPYEVKLEVFEGPIDLLLHLITRQRVDIYDISISTITDEYLRAVEQMQQLDLDIATGFLVVAATLLELKSARLLPSRRMDEAEAQLLEERDLLLARLVECSTFREAGMWISQALASGEGFHGRAVSLEPQFVDLAPDLLARLNLDQLGRAAATVLAPKPQVVLDTSHVQPIRASVRDAIIEVAAALKEGERSFTDLCRGAGERIDVVVRFLALLELFKAGAVDIEQFDRFGDIRASWTGDANPEDMAELADEYSIEGG